MANKSGFIALLTIIAILTMSVAMLAGYILLFDGVSQERQVVRENNDIVRRPSDKELGIKRLFDDKQLFVLKSENPSKQSVLRVGINLRFYKSVKGIKNCEAKIDSFESEIKELVGTYFQEVTLEQVKDRNFRIDTKATLKSQINDLLNSSEKVYSEIIYDIVFDDWFYQ